MNWASILKCVRRKYERLAPTCTVAAGFSKLLEQFSGGDFGRTLLIFPNRWPQFDLRAAFSLAQIILSQSALNVFVVAHAHPLSTPENAHELNPHLTGYSSLAEVEERIFVGCPVGLGERDGWEDEAKTLPRTFVRLLLLRMKKKVAVSLSAHSCMFQKVSLWVPPTYVPSSPPCPPRRVSACKFFQRGMQGS